MAGSYRDLVRQAVRELCRRASFELPQDVLQALRRAREREQSDTARWVLDQLVQNAQVASEAGLPICQDTGVAIVFLQVGPDAGPWSELEAAAHAGVAECWQSNPLRPSILADPLDRASNTGDNTPAVVHLEASGEPGVRISVLLKGGGSENASALFMLSPGQGAEGIIERVAEHVREQGGKPCPPVILGIGIGGTAEQAMLAAKKALLRPVGSCHDDPTYADLERRIMQACNKTGIGPMGLGGSTTCLAVHIEALPCHIATLPVAVSVLCHAARRASARVLAER